MALQGRIEKEIEEKKMLQETQAGFRKGRGTIDNIYIIKHIAGERLKKKRGKLYTFFIDLKAAFDMLNRRLLIETLIKKSKGLIKRICDIYKETKNSVKVEGKFTKEFWTKRDVRQGYPLSATLFALYISDIEKYMAAGQEGGIVIGNRKIWTLAYTDDLVLLAETEKELKNMMKRLEKYVKKKKLELNEDKSKVMVMSKGGKRKKVEWKWMEKEIEEVQEIKYLGYMISRNNNDKKHIKELARKANAALGQI